MSKYNVSIKIQKEQLLACWWCVKAVINNNIPANPSEVGLLMELMGDLAGHENLWGATNENDYKTVSINVNKATALWHCMNVVLNNRIVSDHTKATQIIKAFEILAPELQAVTNRLNFGSLQGGKSESQLDTNNQGESVQDQSPTN